MTPGKRREKLHFQARPTGDDGYGNESGPFATVFTEYAELLPLKGGGESVLASRLSGVQPYIIRVPGSAAARNVTTAWRAVDARNQSRIFNITSVANFDQRNAYIDMMARQGVVT